LQAYVDVLGMYQWYRQATRCYAYLEDVHASVDSIQSSRWFTRGWTLQEPIAPTNVQFYGHGWVDLGTRAELANIIFQATGIEKALLNDNTTEDPATSHNSELRLHSQSVAKRMSWAARRQTTRIEDEAYCLLGLFGVNMPLLYGEGCRAFIRLQEQIARTWNDESLLAWSVPYDVFMESAPSTRTQFYNFFSPSPKYFAAASEIVNIVGRTHDSKLTVSARGLDITLPLYKFEESDEHQSFALLNCQYNSDPFTCIGIRLQSVYHGGYVRLPDGNVHAVAPWRDIEPQDLSWKDPQRAIEKFSQGKAATAEERRITMLNENEILSIDAQMVTQSLTVYLRYDALHHHGFELRSETQESSERHTRVVQLPEDSLLSLEFEHPTQNLHFVFHAYMIDKDACCGFSSDLPRDYFSSLPHYFRQRGEQPTFQGRSQTAATSTIDLEITPMLRVEYHFERPVLIVDFYISTNVVFVGTPRERVTVPIPRARSHLQQVTSELSPGDHTTRWDLASYLERSLIDRSSKPPDSTSR
jgi:hypothetical protein